MDFNRVNERPAGKSDRPNKSLFFNFKSLFFKHFTDVRIVQALIVGSDAL